MDIVMKKCSAVLTVVLFALMFVAPDLALAESVDEADYSDPQYPEFFSNWLWGMVVLSSGLAFGVFYVLQKNYLPYDTTIPLFASLVFISALILMPSYIDKNFYGWFGDDCFKENVVTANREPADWPAPINLRPGECIEARENVEALGIKSTIRSYQKGFLDYRPLTTGEIEFIYSILLMVWTWGLYGLALFLYKKLVIR
jgi:hypothetical protein